MEELLQQAVVETGEEARMDPLSQRDAWRFQARQQVDDEDEDEQVDVHRDCHI
jgi:hypothetical protein